MIFTLLKYTIYYLLVEELKIMKYCIAKMNAIEFYKERKKPVKIAKANKKEDYYLILDDREPTKNYKIIEIVDDKQSKQ